MNELEFNILGQSYRLACGEGSQERLAQAVAIVNQAMADVQRAGKVHSREKIAVLVALNLAYELGRRADPQASVSDAEGSLLGIFSPLPAPALPTAAEALIETMVARIDAVLTTAQPSKVSPSGTQEPGHPA